MSQVKKLQSGGTFTIDGIKYKATPEFINSLTAHLRDTAGTDAQTLAGLTTALQNGEDLTYNSASNTITGMDGLWGGITERQDRRRDAGSSRWKKWWEAQFDTDAHRFRNALSAIGSFHYQVPKAEEETPTNLKDIYGNSDWFDYITGDDGTVKWSDNSSRNAGLIQRLDDMTAYLRDPETGKKTYRLASEYTPQHMSALQGLYDQKKDRWDDTLNQIKERARNNQLDDADKAFLKNFFILKPDATPEEAEAAALAADKKRFADAGFDYDKWSPYIIWDKDNNYWGITSEGQQLFRNYFGGNGNYWFNDAFKNSSKYNPNGAFDFLHGYFILGDRLYKQDDANDPTSALSQILRREGGFRDLNAGMRHVEANDLIEQLWGNEVGWNAPDAQYYSNWLDPNGNVYYRSRTGDYDWNGKTNGQQLIEWIEANPELADAFGYYDTNFRVTDENGNIDLDMVGPEILPELRMLPVGKRTPSDFQRRRLWFSEDGDSAFDGRYLLGDAIDENGKVTGAGFWIDPNNPDAEWIFESDEMGNYVPDLKDQAVRIPKEMSAILMQNPKFMKNFQNNSEFRNKFARVMAGAVGRGLNFSTAYANVSPALWESMGFTKEQAKELSQIGRQYSENNRWRGPLSNLLFMPIKTNRSKRRAERMVSKPDLFKDGGVVKADAGSMLGSSGTTSASATRTKTNAPIQDVREFTNFGKGKLQPHDWMELLAIAADATSIGLAFVPGANIGTGITGAVGSTAGFLADVRRDGFQGSDLTQYGINLGLDAVSFIPVLGGLGKTGKVLNNLKKAAPVIDKLMKAAALYGIPHAAVQSWDAIQNGNFNMRDLRAVVNAIGGAAHLARSGFKRPVRMAGETTYPTISAKNSGKDLVLNDEMLKAINKDNATIDSVSETIAKELSKGAISDAQKFTAEKVKENWDIDSIFKDRRRFLLFGEKQSKAKKFEAKTKRGIEFQDISKNEAARNRHEAYRRNLAGEMQIQHTTTGPERTVTEYVPEGMWRPEYKEVVEIQGVPQRTGTFIGTENGVYVPSNNVPAIVNKRRVITNEADKALPVVLRPVTRKVPGETITYTDLTTRMTPITSGVLWEREPNELRSPAEAIGPYQVNYSRGYMWRPNNQPVFRKEGGVLKAQFGTTLKTPTFNINQGLGAPIKDKILENVGQLYTVPTGTTPTFVPTTPKPLDSSTTSFKVINPITGQTAVSTKQADSNSYEEPTFEGTSSERKWNPDLNVPMNWARSLYAMKQSDKQLRNFLNRPDYQPSDLLLNAPRYINTGSGNAYRKQADVVRMSKPVTSDALQNDLMQRERQQQAMQLELQGDLADSQEYGQYKAGLDQFLTDYAKQRYNIAEQAKQLRWQRGIEDVQAKNANIAEKSKFFDQAAYATQDWWNRNYQGLNQINALDANQAEIAALEKEYATKMSDYRARHANDPNSDAAVQELAGINSWLSLRKQGLGKAGALEQLSPSFRNRYDRSYARYAKAGGKVGKGKQSAVTYSRDPYPELLIQNSKDSAEAVKQLNDAVIKLLLQTKPINVH